jgi:hypothetical protein
MHIARLARRVGGAVALAGCVVLSGFAAPAAFADPQGNNGTIKVDRVEFDDHSNNEPHVGCVFQVDFYGFDRGDLEAKVTFKAHPPTGDRQVLLTDKVFIGGDDNSGGGSQAGLDASKTYTLDFTGIEPHKKGFHVKLTINAEGSQGADKKHKVFWVKECVTPEPSKTPTPEPSKTPAPEPSKTPAPEPSASVTSPAPVPTEVPAGADAAGGDGSAAGLVGLAVVAGGAVAGTVVIARRRFLHDS